MMELGLGGEGRSNCLYLGLPDDARTHFTFSSGNHRCHAGRRPQEVEIPFQEEYCLASKHVTCPRFRMATRRAGVARGDAPARDGWASFEAPQAGAVPPLGPRTADAAAPAGEPAIHAVGEAVAQPEAAAQPETAAETDLPVTGPDDGRDSASSVPRSIDVSVPVPITDGPLPPATEGSAWTAWAFPLESSALEATFADGVGPPAGDRPDGDGAIPMAQAGGTLVDDGSLPGSAASVDDRIASPAAPAVSVPPRITEPGEVPPIEAPAQVRMRQPGLGPEVPITTPAPRRGGRRLVVGLVRTTALLVVLVVAALAAGYGLALLTARALEGQGAVVASPSAPAAEVTPVATSIPAASVPNSPSAAPTGAPTASPSAAPTAATTPKPRVHVVKAGETLSMIATRYGVSIQAIIEANNLQNPNLLLVGQKLTIPPKPAAPSPSG
jgi:LysM repeat protein